MAPKNSVILPEDRPALATEAIGDGDILALRAIKARSTHAEEANHWMMIRRSSHREDANPSKGLPGLCITPNVAQCLSRCAEQASGFDNSVGRTLNKTPSAEEASSCLGKAFRRLSQSSQLSEANSVAPSTSLRNSISSLYGRVSLEDYEHFDFPERLGTSTHVEIASIADEPIDFAAIRTAHRRSGSQEREALCELAPALSVSLGTRRRTHDPLPRPPLPDIPIAIASSRSAFGSTQQSLSTTSRCTTRETSVGDASASSGETSKFWLDLQELDAVGWYWGPLSRRSAETKLDGKPEGTFLVRDSSDRRHLFALSVRTGSREVRHYLVKHSPQGYSWYERRSRTSLAWGLTQRSTHAPKTSLVDLVRETVEASRRLAVRECEVFLIHPLSRFAPVQSLQHMARFAVRRSSSLTIDNIDRLPVPPILKEYLKDSSIY